MLHILIGGDDFSIRQALEAIKKSAGDPASLMPNTTELEGAKVTPEQLRSVCETVPFLADKRLVVVDGLFERFEPKGKNGKKKTSRQSEPAENHQPFAEAVKNIPPFTELVIIGGNIGSTNLLLHELAPKAKVSTFPLLKGNQINQWVEKRVGKGGISKKAVDLMVRLVGNDLWAMANEVDKLALYTCGRQIEEADVKTIVSRFQETKVYNLVDAIIESRITVAQELLQHLFSQGMAPSQILVYLAGHVSLILQVREMRIKGQSLQNMQAHFKPTPPYVVQKAWQQSDRYSLPRLKEVYHKLLEADIAIKTGKYDNPDLVMNILIAELGYRGAVKA